MPQPFRNAVITDDGADLLMRAQVGKTKIQFTRIAVGNGIYSEAEKGLDTMQAAGALRAEKNSYPLDSAEVQTSHSVKVMAVITNMELQTKGNLVEQGYYINEIGLFAKLSDGSGEEILYSIAVTDGEHGDFMPPYNGIFPCRIIQSWVIAVDNAENVKIEYGDDTYVLATELKKWFAAAFDTGIITAAFKKVYNLKDSTPDPTAMTAGQVAEALGAQWDGETSPDPTAMTAGQVADAIKQ